MKILKWLVIVLSSLIMISCAVDTVEETTVIDSEEREVDPDAPNFLLSSLAEKGLCYKGGDVKIFPLNELEQDGTHYIGETVTEYGQWEVSVQMDPEIPKKFEGKFDVDCSNEVTGQRQRQELSLIGDSAFEVNNANVLTTIALTPTRALNRINGNEVLSITEIKAKILDVFGFVDTGLRLAEMSLQDGNAGAAQLIVASSIVLYGRDEVQQKDFMVEVAQAIINNNITAVKQVIQETKVALKLMDIKHNLENSYALVGEVWNYVNFFSVAGAPDYYADLLERNPLIQAEVNLEDNTSCSFDQNDFNLYGTPITFTSAIESSRYLAINLPADVQLSVHTIGVDGNGKPAPGVKLLDITALREIILDTPVKLSYNGFLGDNHGLTAGTYYLKIRKDTDFTLSKTCGGERLYDNYTLASEDEGLTWIGDSNNADRFFYFSGLKFYTTD